MIRLASLQARIACVLTVALLGFPASAVAAPWWGREAFAHPAFAAQWARADDPAVRAGRGWTWGPGPWFDSFEFFREGTHGLRPVQYFDKGRMELGTDGTVTNGLLVVEMVSGFQQTGLHPDDRFGRGPGFDPVAGDPRPTNPDAPDYFSFQFVSTLSSGGRRDADRRGQSVGATLSRGGSVGQSEELANRYADQTRIARYIPETGHNIPEVFWRFLVAEGPVLEGGRLRRGPIINWVAVMGYPISDAYWVRATVGGTPRDVLVQLYERRILTFTPTNPPAFEVEQANVGQHYFSWRYPSLGTPWAGAPGNTPIVFTTGTPDSWSLARIGADGNEPTLLTDALGNLPAAASQRRTYTNGLDYVLFDSPHADGHHRQIYAVPHDGQGQALRLTYTDLTPPFPYSPYPPVTTPSNTYHPAGSPDGSKIAFVSDRTGRPQLFLMGYTLSGVGAVGEPAQLTSDACDYAEPAWIPDGRGLVWAAQCDGDWQIYRGELAYSEDSLTFAGRYYRNNVRATLVNIVQLTSNSSDDRAPRISPDATRIAFTAIVAGVEQVMVMSADGTGARTLVAGRSPTWSPSGDALAFASNNDGDWEIYRLDLSSGAITRLTDNSVTDQLPVWGS